MRFRLHLPVALCAVAGVACGTDRTTGPGDEAARAAAEFERAAADLGFAAGPTAALTYQSAASALRGGAKISTVSVTVGTETSTWNAFGHEIRFQPPPVATVPAGFEPPVLRALLAWRSTPTGLRIIHLIAAGDDGEIRELRPIELGVDLEPDELDLELPSFLMYAEARNALWEAASGRQKSSVVATTTPCPEPPQRPAGAPPPPACVEASFTFELTGVEARPFVPRFTLVNAPPNSATGTRTISMPSQTVTGVRVTHTLPAFPLISVVGLVRP